MTLVGLELTTFELLFCACTIHYAKEAHTLTQVAMITKHFSWKMIEKLYCRLKMFVASCHLILLK